MPEGHTIHRYARKHQSALAGHAVAASSPQGRFSAGAARINGQVLDAVDAHGKHLFYRWEGGETLHVHLGLFGKFRTHLGDPPKPSEATRLALARDNVTIYLAGPTICELIDPATVEAILARLGPDPLQADRPGNDALQFATNLARRRIPIGASLLDQRVIAGVGNVYRAEALFLTGIDPFTPSNQLSKQEIEYLWKTIVKLLRRGEKTGRIVTVEPADVGATRRDDLLREDRLYVYHRQSQECRRCGTPVRIGELANRNMWWCPTCQTAAEQPRR